jgi:excisionase family DNA binding protein
MLPSESPFPDRQDRILGRKEVQKTEQQTAQNEVNVSQEFFSIQDLSRYLGIKASTLYVMVEERNIPHYRVGKLIRFRRSEIDDWMGGNKKDCVAPEKVAMKALRSAERHKLDIDRVVKKAIDGVNGKGYTTPHGKPDQVKGLGREVKNGTL